MIKLTYLKINLQYIAMTVAISYLFQTTSNYNCIGVGSIYKVGRSHYQLRVDADVVVKPKIFAREVK